MRKRIAYYDILRGIAIIGVIIIHSSGNGYAFKASSLDFIGTVVLREFVNFAVPLFIALSGFFLANKKFETNQDYWKFIKKQISRVLIPYLLWSLLYSIVNFQKGEGINVIVYKYFTFQSCGPMYFIFLIIQYYLLLPILKKMANRKGLIVSMIISLLSCILIFYFRHFTDFNLPLVVYGGFFPTYLVFFVLGLYLRNNKVKYTTQKLIPFIVAFFILSCIETYLLYLKFNDIRNAVNGEKIGSFLYAIAFVMLFFRNVKLRNLPMMTYTGEISFGIYLSHIVILGRVAPSILVRLWPQINSYGLFLQLMLVITTLLFCILFAYVTRRINKNVAVKYLGQ